MPAEAINIYAYVYMYESGYRLSICPVRFEQLFLNLTSMLCILTPTIGHSTRCKGQTHRNVGTQSYGPNGVLHPIVAARSEGRCRWLPGCRLSTQVCERTDPLSDPTPRAPRKEAGRCRFQWTRSVAL